MAAETTTLANGARILAVHLPHLRSVTVAVLVNTGGRNETAATAGISHFLEHMVFKGTSRRSGWEITSTVERLGAELNAYTAKDRTVFHVTGLVAHVDQFIALLGELLSDSQFPDHELAAERQVILHEIDRSLDSPAACARQLADRAAFGDHAYALPLLGNRYTVRSFDRADLLAHVRHQYTGGNVVIAVAGHLGLAEVAAPIERAFGSLPSGAGNRTEPPVWRGGIETAVRAARQSRVILGLPVANLREDFYADAVAAAVIGDGMSSPLFSEVREKRGLAYQIDSYAQLYDDMGRCVISAGTSPEQLGGLLRVTGEVLRGQAERISAVDLERARNGLAVAAVRAAERPLDLATDYAESLLTHGEVRSVDNAARRLRAVTADQVRERIARMLQQRPAVAVVGEGASPALVEEALAGWGTPAAAAQRSARQDRP